LRRIGSNIRKQNDDARANRPTESIIEYSTQLKPKNDFPRKIVSPPLPSACCTEKNREIQGRPEEIEGFNFHYKVCNICGHAVKFFSPAMETTSKAVKQYRKANRYMAQ
jgi:hypothetical protein